MKARKDSICPSCGGGTGSAVLLGTVKNKIGELFDELYVHDGFGGMEIDMRILKRGQKEILVRCGKEFRFVVDFSSKIDAAQGRAADKETETN
ncbi:MAG: hypothetical protein JXR78_10160 [Victivallales bacterium]|nr:hypothetical protein [Victivallales bacterium]